MPLEIRKIQVWCGEIPDLLGAAAAKLEHLVAAGADLKFVYTRPHPHKEDAGVIFLAPITGEEQVHAARRAHLAPAIDVAMLYVQGPNRKGMGYDLMRQLAIAGIPMQGMSISAAGEWFGAYLAFEDPDDASKAVQVLAALEV